MNLDFGYPWWLSYGHLSLAAPAGALAVAAFRRGWARWAKVLLSGVALWAGLVFLLIRFGVDINAPAAMPTQAFLREGKGRVLDLGAGTGRSSIMVLTARPGVTLVASDLFGESFDHHFGHGESGEERLRRNLRAAGVEQRATIVKADMRELPFEAGSFDAIVSAYAVDHLNREGIRKALAEAARVVKPGGEFLLILVANDKWAKLAFGPVLSHGGTRPVAWWSGQLREAGFTVEETGTAPVTQYLVAKKR